MKQTHSELSQDLIARLISRERGEEPVISLYINTAKEHRAATLKNLIKDGEAQIEGDTGWDAERKKAARGLLEKARVEAEERFSVFKRTRRSFAVFVDGNGMDVVELPLEVRQRTVVDRSPYASPLSSLVDQYERFGVILCGNKTAKLFDVYLKQLHDWEEIEGEHKRHRGAPAGGPARSGTKGAGGYHGLEELRRKNHAEYVLHQHLQAVADRAFRRHKLRPFDRLILLGAKDVVAKLEEHLHSYLKERVVAREPASMDLTPDQARDKVLALEEQVEKTKEEKLLAEIQDRKGKSGLGSVGISETLQSLFYGKVGTLVVVDDEAVPGRECPECHYLFEWPEDQLEKGATLVECPLCKRPTRRVPDIVDEAIELAILSGARVEHITHVKEQLVELGGMAGVLRFK